MWRVELLRKQGMRKPNSEKRKKEKKIVTVEQREKARPVTG